MTKETELGMGPIAVVQLTSGDEARQIMMHPALIVAESLEPMRWRERGGGSFDCVRRKGAPDFAQDDGFEGRDCRTVRRRR